MVNKYVVSTVQRYEVLQYPPIPHLGYFSFLSHEEKKFFEKYSFRVIFLQVSHRVQKKNNCKSVLSYAGYKDGEAREVICGVGKEAEGTAVGGQDVADKEQANALTLWLC